MSSAFSLSLQGQCDSLHDENTRLKQQLINQGQRIENLLQENHELEHRERQRSRKLNDLLDTDEFQNKDAILVSVTSIGATNSDTEITTRTSQCVLFNPNLKLTQTKKQIFKKQEMDQFCGLLGAELFGILTLNTKSVAANKPLNTLSSYQKAIPTEEGGLWHLVYGLSTGKLEPPLLNDDYRSLTTKQRRGPMSAMGAFSMILSGSSDQEKTATSSFLRNVVGTYPATPPRVVQSLVRTCVAKTKTRDVDTAHAKSIRSIQMINDCPLYSIVGCTQDNVGWKGSVNW